MPLPRDSFQIAGQATQSVLMATCKLSGGTRRKSTQADGSAGISRELKDAGEKLCWDGRGVELLKRVNAPSG